jgi:predicted nucleic acid-binding protein
MQAALDTNLLVYAEGIAFAAGDAVKSERMRALLRSLPPDEVAVPVQVLGELYRVLVGKAKWSSRNAREAVALWRDLYPPVDTTAAAMTAALELAGDHRVSIWDAVVLAAAAEAGCRMLLSEDFKPGFAWRGVTVVNPLAAVQHPMLALLLAMGS